MAEKKFILTAEGLGWSKDINKAILEGLSGELLKSACIIPNGKAFDDAISSVINVCPDLGVGLSLNITRGQSLCEDLRTLTDVKDNFCNSFLKLLVKAYNPKEKEFLEQVEREFRRQIEKTLSKTRITHLTSVDNIHAIPKIFEITSRLAKEYGIKYIRTHFEKPHFIPDVHKHFSCRYLTNLIKSACLGCLTVLNEAIAHRHELKTNDYLVGIIYQSMMTSLTVVYGVMAIKYDKVLVEASINPCRYEDGTIDNNFNEYLITKNKKLKEKIEKLGFEITNYVEKEV